MESIDGDLTYKDALVVNLAKAAAAVVQHVLQGLPPEVPRTAKP